MNAQRLEKEAQVKEISEKLNNAKAVVVAEYAGLTVKELQSLRSELEKSGVEAKIYKNRLFKIANKDAGVEELEKDLLGPNLYVFGMEDEFSPAKILARFAKEHKSLKLKAGIYEGKYIDEVGVNEVASLPSMEEALTMLATGLIYPVRTLGTGLHLLIEEDKLETNTNDNVPEEKSEEQKENAANNEANSNEEEIKKDEDAPAEAEVAE